MIHAGDVGTPLKGRIVDQNGAVVDVSSVVAKKLLFRKPDGTTVVKDAIFDGSNGTNGVVLYLSEPGFLVEGVWKMQAKVGWSQANIKSSEVQTFRVYENIDVIGYPIAVHGISSETAFGTPTVGGA